MVGRSSEGTPGNSSPEPMHDATRASDLMGARGLALADAWIFLGSFSEVFRVSPDESAFSFISLRLIGFLSFILCFYGVRKFSDQLSVRSIHPYLYAAIAVFGSILPVLYLINITVVALPYPLLAFGWIGFGIASVFMFVIWEKYCSGLPRARTMPYITLAIILAGFWYFIVSSLGSVLALCVTLVTPLLSLLCFVAYSRESALPKKITRADSELKLELSPFSAFTICWNGICFALLLQYVLVVPQVIDANMIVSLGILIGAIGVSAAFFIRKDRFITFSTIRRVLYPLFILGLAVFAFSSGVVALICLIAVLAVANAFDISNWSTMAAIASRYRAQPTYHFSRVRGPFMVGIFIGWLVGFILFCLLPEGSLITLQSVFLALIALFAVVISAAPGESVAFSMKESSGADSQKPESKSGSWKKACMNISFEYDLTPREREVFLLLAKGRSAAVIEKELAVSTSTVKSHTSHIYQKLGISSRQELIDKVERYMGHGRALSPENLFESESKEQ